VFGAGLIEAIPDATIAANVVSGKAFGIIGHENRNGNDGTITRFRLEGAKQVAGDLFRRGLQRGTRHYQ
jgi:hypothetical protein